MGRRQNISFKGKQGDTALRLLEKPPHLERAWNSSCLPPVPDILNLVLTTLELHRAVPRPKQTNRDPLFLGKTNTICVIKYTCYLWVWCLMSFLWGLLAPFAILRAFPRWIVSLRMSIRTWWRCCWLRFLIHLLVILMFDLSSDPLLDNLPFLTQCISVRK